MFSPVRGLKIKVKKDVSEAVREKADEMLAGLKNVLMECLVQ